MRTYDDIKVGDKDFVKKVVTEADVADFARISTDNNPVHLDEEYAKTTPFKSRIAHGMFSAGLISAVLGTKLPGYGTIYLSQDLKFRAPVYLGDELTAYVEVVEKIDAKKRLRMRTWVENQKGNVVTEGEAMVMFNV
ncbi:MAG: MaoC family dehydratase [Bacillota bacterium]|uniref:Enoyl-CoA hydratase n=1 Tax=Thermanaerosceptrum fracticalcis TaxID=1712410 RepID=A0A7G6DZT7_THEFR|nr:MaoC family dehydratase [Thermanaerosceptrum fracticalcis]QNB45341.1 enoyl-CoA hydratase [Thermanaerosceptrum fracticalcis]